jgi:AraC-like DNA-binding protein
MGLMVEELHASDVLPPHLSIPDDPRAKSICEAILANSADGTTIDQWARRLRVTSKTVHRLFVKGAGMTFVQWREQLAGCWLYVASGRESGSSTLHSTVITPVRVHYRNVQVAFRSTALGFLRLMPIYRRCFFRSRSHLMPPSDRTIETMVSLIRFWLLCSRPERAFQFVII